MSNEVLDGPTIRALEAHPDPAVRALAAAYLNLQRRVIELEAWRAKAPPPRTN